MTDSPPDVPSVNELREFFTGRPVEPRPAIIEVPAPRCCDGHCGCGGDPMGRKA